MAITAVGSLTSSTGTGSTSIAVSPTTLGNALVLYVKDNSSTITLTGVSGGGCTGWAVIADPWVDSAGTVATHQIWVGRVTATGAATITLTFSASVAAVAVDIDVQEFTAGLGSSTTWARDGSQQGHTSSASATTVTYPSLTPSGSGGLYFGHARCLGSESAGSTTGFTYVTDANGHQVAYNGNVSGAVAPTAPQTSGAYYALAVLIIASTSTTHALAATGLASSSGSMALNLIEPIASTGLASSTGAFLLGIPQPLAATGLASSSGSMALGIPQVLAATGFAASTGGMDLAVRRVLAASGLASSSGSMFIFAGGIQDPFATVVSPAKPPLLDCGIWRVFIATRGGGHLLAELAFETLSLNRKLNDVSTCTVTVSADQNEDCAPILSDIEPFEHELVAFRNYAPGDSPAWVGPVTLPTWDPLGLSIAGRDLFAWLERRTLPFNRSFTLTDLAAIFGSYIVDALVQDGSPNITPLFLGEIGVKGTRSVLASSSTVAGDALRELGRSGVDFTVVGRTLRYGGLAPSSVSAVLYDQAVVQDSSGPKLSKQGLNMATRITVKGATLSSGGQIVSTVGIPDAEHGLISVTVSEPLIMDTASASNAGTGRLAFLNPAPIYLNCSLSPQAPIRFDRLVPGIRIDTAFRLGLITVAQPFRLREVNVAVDSAGTETVSLVLVPLVT